jgi:site-specific DNA recombinase
MNKPRNGTVAPTTPCIRCAIYTRKSTEEGLEKEFNTLDAQREAGEAYIRSQAHEGWTCLADRYDDGGYTGGDMDRPALQRLLADIEAGRVDVVVAYKVDRFSRSLLDFARMMATFEKHQVSFVSVTQQFNTATSMGRLMLNVLLSFAQFEREIISERTRDKIAAARRKGKWIGGHPILGYDVDVRCKLVVNDAEARRVRAIFALYLELEGLVPVVEELARRGWVNKRWVTRKGPERGGRPFMKTTLHHLLTNVAYIGKVRYKAELHDAEHEALIDPDTWQKVQALLQRNGRSGGTAVRNQFGALLKGILRCVPCACAMTPAHSTRRHKRWRYYTCTNAQKRGWASCPSKSIPAGAIERFVVEQIKCIGRDPALRSETFAAARAQVQTRMAELEGERAGLEAEVGRWNAEIRASLEQTAQGGTVPVTRLAELQERIHAAERRSAEIHEQLRVLGHEKVNECDVELALSMFDPVWETLTPQEQTRVVQLLVERVDFNGATSTVAITFHPSGIKTLAEEITRRQRGKTA